MISISYIILNLLESVLMCCFTSENNGSIILIHCELSLFQDDNFSFLLPQIMLISQVSLKILPPQTLRAALACEYRSKLPKPTL